MFLNWPWVTVEIRLSIGEPKHSSVYSSQGASLLNLNSNLRQDLCMNPLCCAWRGRNCDAWACLDGSSAWMIGKWGTMWCMTVHFLLSLANWLQELRKGSAWVSLCVTASTFSSPLLPPVGFEKEEGLELHHLGKITMCYILCTFFKTGLWLILHFSQSTQLLGIQLDDILHNSKNNWLLLIRESMQETQGSHCR